MNRLTRLKAAVVAAVLMLQPMLVGTSSLRPLPQFSGLDSRTLLLPDGRLLRVGGSDSEGAHGRVAIWSPVDGEWSQLPFELMAPRLGHTATLLPDGTVLVLGGRDESGGFVETAEIADPMAGTTDWANYASAPRTSHSATVLTDGRVLVVGGVGVEGVVRADAELWDPWTGNVARVGGHLLSARSRHAAELSDDGRVRLKGGIDSTGLMVGTEDELYDPVADTFQRALEPAMFPGSSGVFLSGGLPHNESVDVALETIVSLRFSGPLLVTSVSERTVQLSRSGLVVPAKVVALEGGRLVFLSPATPLEPSTRYTITVQGATDEVGGHVPPAAVSFVTSSREDRFRPSSDDESWTPTEGQWRTGRSRSPWEDLPPRFSLPDVTALSGRVLRLNGQPLKGVVLELDGTRALTDETGRCCTEELRAVRGRRHDRSGEDQRSSLHQLADACG
jgi:hypothetical protein